MIKVTADEATRTLTVEARGMVSENDIETAEVIRFNRQSRPWIRLHCRLWQLTEELFVDLLAFALGSLCKSVNGTAIKRAKAFVTSSMRLL